MNHESDKAPARWQYQVALLIGISSLVIPSGLALFIPWAEQSSEFIYLATTHLLGFALVSLALSVLLRLVAAVGSRSDFRSRLATGFVSVGLVTFTALRWVDGFEGGAGNGLLVITQMLTLAMMLLVVGYLFEFLRSFARRMQPLEKDTEDSKPEVAT